MNRDITPDAVCLSSGAAAPVQRHRIVLIPSLEPQENFVPYVKQLQLHGFDRILVIDDGSGSRYLHIFDELSRCGATVLVHERNQGKGAAIKTGLAWIQRNIESPFIVVTADSDGQHTVPDVVRMAGTASEHPDSLVLGQRDFSSSGTPWKSSVGNTIATMTFAALYHRRLADTQTGLRAFGDGLVDGLLGLDGRGFEYETQMLVMAVRRHIPLLTLPISTIYEAGNGGTHFQPVRDSIAVVKALAGNLLSFSASSLVCALVDYGLAQLLFAVRFGDLPLRGYTHILIATGLARAVSIALNFLINNKLIFKGQGHLWPSLGKYLLLSVALILMSATGVYLLGGIGVQVVVAKPLCDVLLFFVSYWAQQSWVFASKGKAS